jgi:hypothetical protein
MAHVIRQEPIVPTGSKQEKASECGSYCGSLVRPAEIPPENTMSPKSQPLRIRNSRQDRLAVKERSGMLCTAASTRTVKLTSAILVEQGI